MAFDKIIDSAALDAGMTATANAIREKTGNADPIVWEELNGFKKAVEAISAGGGGDTYYEDGLITRTLTEYSNDRVTVIGDGCFMNNRVIEEVSFPNVTEFVGANQFNGCTALKSVYFPKLTNAAGGNAFRNSGLTEITLPSYDSRMSCPSFQACASLEFVDIANCMSIGGSTFNGCTKLKVIILRNVEKPVSLSNVNAFQNSPFAVGGTGGTVFVPEALIVSYANATNWSTLNAAGTCDFVSIEGSIYE